MNKYFIRIGESLLDRWGGDYIAFSTKSEQELLDTYEFMVAVGETLVDLYYEFGEDYEEEGEFVDSGGVNKIRLFNEETDDNNLDIIYDERWNMF